MTALAPRPTEALASTAAAEERLLRTVARMRPEQVFEPSALPGWTRGHVLTHLARNADALINLLTSARTGAMVPMYASPEARDQEIAAGAARPLPEQLEDLRTSGQRLAGAAAALPDAAWAAEVHHRLGPVRADSVPPKRLAEIEYHLVDLALDDCTPARWPSGFVDAELTPLTGRLLASGVLGRELLDRLAGVPRHALLAWLSGRSDGSDLGVPAADLPPLPALR
ncbi:maleylpyruvate isomerase N-terminal domain-containing protein [Streptacidiphilus sp. P02-A3a]|uniref:maleylpyruvate isomerase N-terminal domain-containing protein n=1 Tax=Streptacidiphilus sp. P02-A3a TaxID=2704468 RepID=UPI0015F88400|nr:maleylpyruvate isomerase N-terminal domain-containing protein [Streptacidiphilus sp. P02-A3a]QMU72050.1 maleylpyruvate isomerase family mycothiol-dependent enzyme [Streptacidiphilus sp. P02-A3a]